MNFEISAERRPRSVQFFFDPLCPFAYQTSRWIRAVAARTDLRVHWRFFSLQEGNRKGDESHPWEEEWAGSWSLMRVGAMLRTRDESLLDRWYAAIGRTTHEEGRPAYDRTVAHEIVRDLGLPSDTIERALSDERTNELVRSDHEWLVSTHAGFGVPTLVFPGYRALYGPVVAPAPQGDEAMRLWDVTLTYLAIPGLYELKTPRTHDDMQRIQKVFAPTQEARELSATR